MSIFGLGLYLALLVVTPATGDEEAALEPEYIGTFHFLDREANQLVLLERPKQRIRSKARFHGFGGGKVLAEFDGTKSPVRFKKGQKLEFVVRVSSRSIDPATLLQLFVVESADPTKKQARRGIGGARAIVAIKQRSAWGSVSVDPHGGLEFNAAKYGEESFRLVPAGELPPGEYALGFEDGSEYGYFFGIDPFPTDSETEVTQADGQVEASPAQRHVERLQRLRNLRSRPHPR